MKPLPDDDLDAIVSQARAAFAALQGARLFVTGGTGFFGHWLLESLLHANARAGVEARATVLTRNAERFRAASPWIANDPAITLIEGNARDFAFADGAHTHVVHAATDTVGQDPQGALAEEIVGGTRRVLEFARRSGAKRLLYVSSGAVYGRSTAAEHTPEEYPLPALEPQSYETAKQRSERACLRCAELETVIARCFAFVGPRLPLDRHFAIGNFIGAALNGETLCVKGDGTPRRSWMYTSDLAVWLWTLLAHGEAGTAYNVGSDEPYTIAEAARLTAETLAPGLPVQVAGRAVAGAPLNSYVPSVQRSKTELGLRVTVPLADALKKTAAWYR